MQTSLNIYMTGVQQPGLCKCLTLNRQQVMPAQLMGSHMITDWLSRLLGLMLLCCLTTRNVDAVPHLRCVTHAAMGCN